MNNDDKIELLKSHIYDDCEGFGEIEPKKQVGENGFELEPISDDVAFAWCLIHFNDKEYSTQAFGEFCDIIQRAFTFDVVALRERMIFWSERVDVFESDKKTCTRERLLRTLSVIGDLGVVFEGEGGRMGYGVEQGYVGTGLRHPNMPLHNMPASQRRSVLSHLEAKGLIIIAGKDGDVWTGLAVTDFGKKILDTYHRCSDCGTRKEWYETKGYHQTGATSGYATEGVVCLCLCEKNKYVKASNASANSNMRFGLGKKIEVNE